MQCGQCGNNAFCTVQDYPLCLNCYERLDQILRRKIADGARMINWLSAQIDESFGLPGTSPVIELPDERDIRTGPVTLNNITVNDSVVGSINTGHIEQLDVAVDAVRDAGGDDLADVLQRLTQAILDAPDLAARQKDEAVEHLAFLAEQATLPRGQRKRTIGRQALSALERIVNVAGSVATLWPVVMPILANLFR